MKSLKWLNDAIFEDSLPNPLNKLLTVSLCSLCFTVSWLMMFCIHNDLLIWRA